MYVAAGIDEGQFQLLRLNSAFLEGLAAETRVVTLENNGTARRDGGVLRGLNVRPLVIVLICRMTLLTEFLG